MPISAYNIEALILEVVFLQSIKELICFMAKAAEIDMTVYFGFYVYVRANHGQW